MQHEPLVDYGRPEPHVMVLAGAEEFQLVVVVGLDEGVGDAGQDAGDVLDLEVLREGFDELDHQGHLLAAVELRLRVQAVVAAAAVVLRVVLAEVVEQQLAAALAGFRVGHGLAQELLADLLLRHGLPLHELLQFLDVLVAVVGDAKAFLPVAARPAGFLIITLDALGDVVMDDEPDVGLVDAHAEGDGGDDHLDVLHQEAVLVLRAGFRVQAGVVGEGLDAVDGQQLGQFLHLLAAQAVDDAGLAGVLADEADDVLLGIDLVADLVVEVRAVEGGLEDGGVGDAEVLEDVALDLGRGRRGEGDDRRRLDVLDDGPDLPVFRPEVVAPFGDAVRLVHGVEGDVDLFQEGDVLFLGQGFRRDVQELGDPAQEVLPDLGHLRAAEGGVEEVRDAVAGFHETPDGVHLVLHQGDERGDDDGRSFHHQGGELVAQGLSAAGGHEHEGVASVDQVPDDPLLVTLESIEAEELLQLGLEDGGVDGHSFVVFGIKITKMENNSKRKDAGW